LKLLLKIRERRIRNLGRIGLKVQMRSKLSEFWSNHSPKVPGITCSLNPNTTTHAHWRSGKVYPSLQSDWESERATFAASPTGQKL